MDFTVPEELRALQANARRFTNEELIPLESEVLARETTGPSEDVDALPPGEHYVFDPRGVLPFDTCQRLVDRARDASLWGLDVPESLGGQNAGVLGKMLVLEEINRSFVPFQLPPDSPNLHWLMAACTPEQREKYLLPYAAGEISSCLAASEPGAGADVSGYRTFAERRGDTWVLNGSKIWISRADWVSFMIVLAKTDKDLGVRGGFTAFLVDRGTPGVTIKRNIATITADQLCEVNFENVELADSQVLGKVGWAFPELQNRFSVRRLEVGVRGLAASERLLDMLVSHAKSRVTFGAPLADRQTVQNWIADATAEIHALRLMAYNAAWKLDSGVKDIRYEASIIKVKGSELAGQVADWTLQAHGAMGLSKEMPIEYFYRLARIWRIVEGPSEVHRFVVARNRLKGLRPTVGAQ